MIATFAIVALASYLLIGEPLLGRLSHRRMLAAVRAGRRHERMGFYLRWTWQAWVLLAVTLVVTLGLAHWSPARLGLRWPELRHLASGGFADGALGGFVVGVVFAAVGGAALGIAVQRRSGHDAGRTGPSLANNPNITALLPRSRNERFGFAALALTAGITEEVIWRGFGLTLLIAMLPGAHPAIPITLAALAFGWAHVYQGAAGVAVTAILGGVLATLFWATGSLLLPMLLHVLLDLRVLLVRAPASVSPVTGDDT